MGDGLCEAQAALVDDGPEQMRLVRDVAFAGVACFAQEERSTCGVSQLQRDVRVVDWLMGGPGPGRVALPNGTAWDEQFTHLQCGTFGVHGLMDSSLNYDDMVGTQPTSAFVSQFNSAPTRQKHCSN